MKNKYIIDQLNDEVRDNLIDQLNDEVRELHDHIEQQDKTINALKKHYGNALTLIGSLTSSIEIN